MMVDRPKKKTTTRKRMMKTRIRSGAKTTTKDGLTERERERKMDMIRLTLKRISQRSE